LIFIRGSPAVHHIAGAVFYYAESAVKSQSFSQLCCPCIPGSELDSRCCV